MLNLCTTVIPTVNKTGFDILIIETNALLGKRQEDAETFQHIAS